jgi:hypothetical protein
VDVIYTIFLPGRLILIDAGADMFFGGSGISL